MPNLILLIGIPGSGKSTLAKSLFDLKYKIVSTDEIRRRLHGSLKAAHEGHTAAEKPNNATVFASFHREIEEALAHGVDVIADATFLSRESREEAWQIAYRTGAKVHAVLFQNVGAAFERNANREPDAVVPPDVMEHMMTKYSSTLRGIDNEAFHSILKIGSYT